LLFIFLLVAVAITDTLYFETLFIFPAKYLMLCDLIYLFYALLGFRIMMFNPNQTSLFKQSFFWVNAGLLIYTGIALLSFGLHEYFLNNDSELDVVDDLIYIINMIFYFSIGVSILMDKSSFNNGYKTEVYLVYITGLVAFFILSGFIVHFILFYKKKQTQNKLEQELLQINFQQEIAKTQLEVQEQTMQTIGADLHDNIGQLLSLTSLTLNSIQLDNTKKARQKIDAAIDLTVRSIKEMRLLGKLLQGDQLVVMGLSEAIQYEVNWIEKSGHYKVNYTNDGEMPATSSPEKDLILFRILQEVLNNIIKHAQATMITIKIDYHDAALQLQVRDNGVGFNSDDLPSAQNGMGLQNIQKRAGIIGGEATVSSDAGGTTITIFTPYP